jgi:uncharacterized repeat protein (TIGR04052 family)
MVLLVCVLSLSLLTACDRTETIQLRFKLGPGSDAVHRLQLYVSEVELLRGDGKWERLALTSTPTWQSERVALLDLTGAQPERRGEVTGTMKGKSRQSYAGVRFVVGVPFDLNHANPLSAGAPLNRAELFWSWQSGYKFLRVELTDHEHAGAFHLGSTGCSSASALRPPQLPCHRPNVMRVELRDFDPMSQPIEIRVAELVAALRQSNQAACTGDYESDPACAAAFALTGLDVRDGKCANTAADSCSSQRLFAVP